MLGFDFEFKVIRFLCCCSVKSGYTTIHKGGITALKNKVDSTWGAQKYPAVYVGLYQAHKGGGYSIVHTRGGRVQYSAHEGGGGYSTVHTRRPEVLTRVE